MQKQIQLTRCCTTSKLPPRHPYMRGVPPRLSGKSTEIKPEHNSKSACTAVGLFSRAAAPKGETVFAAQSEDWVAFKVYKDVSRCNMIMFSMFRRALDIGGAFDASTVCPLSRKSVRGYFGKNKRRLTFFP